MKMRRKWILYGGLFIALAGTMFWHAGRLLDAAMDTINVIILDKLGVTKAQTDRAIAYRAREIQLAFDMLPGERLTERDAAFAQLAHMQAWDESRGYYVAFADGALHDSTGRQTGIALEENVLKQAADRGYVSFDASYMAGGKTTLLGLATKAENMEGVYIVQVNDPVDLAEAILGYLAFTPEQLLLFAPGRTDIYTLVAASETESYEKVQSVRFGALDFATSGESIVLKNEKPYGDCLFYLALDQPEGWFLGGRIRTDNLLPLHSAALRTAMETSGSVMIIFLLFVLVDTLCERRRQRGITLEKYTDPLTGLVNAAGFREHMAAFMQREDIIDYSLVLMDISAFHRFNTMFGYEAGDRLLSILGEEIGEKYEIGARVSSDVFAMVTRSGPDIARSAEHQMHGAISREIGKEFTQMISFRFGIYPIFHRDTSFRDAYDGALLALRKAKRLPEGRDSVYDLSLQKAMETRESIEASMLHALSKGEFLVYVQPQFSARQDAFCGGEALVRWQSETMGFMAPDVFIPLFEDNGFVVELDFYMLSAVLEVLQEMVDNGSCLHPISVNQSRVTLTFPNYLERLKALVSHFTVPLHLVQLEITESAMVHDPKMICDLTREIKKLGFSIALDDFGVGFSSLNALRNLPVDVLKIDKGFLKESDLLGRNQLIIKNIINMSKDLNILVVCEGVETEDQLGFLKGLGCDVIQGYYYARPMPLSEYLQTYCDGMQTPDSDA